MPPARLRQWPALAAICAIVALAALAGCGQDGASFSGGTGPAAGFAGAVVADEPHAALAAREVLAEGGSAADAAVALTFALAVTYPSAAGLGGGGQCLVYVPGRTQDSVDSLDFLPGPAGPSPGGGWASAVPGTVRGMDALQARYGRLRWSRTLVAAERLARFGHPVSRALARDLAAGSQALFRDEAVRALFTGDDGRPLSEGETIVQHDLATLLARLRLAGGADFYSGGTARQLADAAARADGALDAGDLRQYRARWVGTVSLPFGYEELHTVPGGGGAVAAAITGLAAADDRYADAEGAERLHLLAEVARRGFALAPAATADALDPALLERRMESYRPDARTAGGGDGGPRLDDAPTTGFIVVDRQGMAVACGLTMNGTFGTGRLAPGSGLVLAAAPEDDPAPPLAPVVLVNRNSRQLFLAAAGGGGAVGASALELVLQDREFPVAVAAGGGTVAPSALARVLLALLEDERPLAAALAAPRLHVGGEADLLAVEPAIAAAARSALAERGHQVVEVPAIGRVNALHCPDGLPRTPESCRFASDRRGFGIGAGGTP